MTTFGGPWTLEKLNILRDYLDAYTTALKNRPSPSNPFRLIYVDAFAGDGTLHPRLGYTDDDYGDFTEMVQGSASLALDIDDRPFDRLVFIERNPMRAESLNKLRADNPHRDIAILNDNANSALPRFCAQMGAYDRAVVFLDPYATQVDWSTVQKIAETQRIDCWIWFPLGAIARIMPRRTTPRTAWADNLDRIFGGRDYWETMYRESSQQLLPGFAPEPLQERAGSSQEIASRYRQRLEAVFTRVASASRTFTNSKNSPMFELFFGAGSPTGAPIAVRIANHLLKKL